MRMTVTAAIFIMVAFILRPASADQFQLVSSEYPPYAYTKDGQVVGIAVDIVRETFRRLGHDVSIKLYPWPHALNNTKTGKADAIFTAYDTPERRQFLDYSRVVLIDQTVSLFALKGKGITYGGDFSQLADKVIGARLGVSYGEIYDDAVSSGLLKWIDTTASDESNVRKLLAGRFDVIISNRYSAMYYLRSQGGLNRVEELTPPVQEIPSFIAFSKVRDLSAVRDAFDKSLSDVRKDGTFDRLIKEYFVK